MATLLLELERGEVRELTNKTDSATPYEVRFSCGGSVSICLQPGEVFKITGDGKTVEVDIGAT